MELTTSYFAKIIEIQEIENLIGEENKKMKELQEKIEKINTEFNSIKEELTKLQSDLRELMVKKKDEENKLQEIEEEIKKHQIELNQIKKEEAYRAVIKEIENAKIQKDEAENNIIKLLYEIENKNNEILKVKNILSEKEKIVIENKKSIEEEITKIKKRIDHLNENKHNLFGEISDENLKKKINSLIKDKGNIGIVKARIINNNSKEEYYCSACNMKITIMGVNILKKPNTFFICENCSRLIYL